MNKEITTTKIAIFRKREIRKAIHNNEWWFVVNDVVLALTDSSNVQDYIKKMRKRDNELSKGWGQFVTPFLSRLRGEIKSLIVPIQKVFFVLSSLFHPLRLSRLNVGWLGSVTNGFKKLRIQSLPQKGQELYIKPKGIAMTGLRNGCVESLSVKS